LVSASKNNKHKFVQLAKINKTRLQYTEPEILVVVG
jgi:hypothetical protein